MWTDVERAALRQHEAEPVLDRIEAYLVHLERHALPKSVLAKAVSYAQNQWQALRRYTTDGRLSIDNNVSERTLRHQAVGRKNWLFLGSECLLFGGLISTYMLYRGRHEGSPSPSQLYNIPLTSVSSFVLLMSSLTMVLAVSGEPQVNPVLLHVLEETHALRISPTAVLSDCGGEDESGHWRVDPESVFASIERIWFC